jgi:formate dehydrogenase subunit gamma
MTAILTTAGQNQHLNSYTPSARAAGALEREAQADMSHCSARASTLPDTILRFKATERLLHWAIAIPFLGCFTSAMVLVVVYNPDPTRAYRLVFAWMHRGCAAALIVCPSLVLLASVRRWHIHLYNIREAWIWTLDDIKWLALMGLAALSTRISLPDQGKFNAAEKLNFMMVMVFPPLFIATGLLIWFPESTTLGSFGPWLAHCVLAALATPLMCGHIVMATINPSTRVGLKGMINGFVSREWAAHHYARWFREQFPDLVEQHADEKPRDDGVAVPAGVETELWSPTAAADPLPVEITQQLPLIVAYPPLGNAAPDNALLGEASVPAPPSPSIPIFTQTSQSMRNASDPEQDQDAA